MSDFLLELLSEEIPARMQAGARNALARMFAEGAAAAGLETGAIETFSTPRRLVLIARAVADATSAAREEVKGPRSSAPPQALAGFLRKTGLAREQIEERDGVLFATIDRPGRPAAEIIAGIVEKIVADFAWPKSMRWGAGELRWVRPLHGIVALLGEQIVPVAIGGIESGAATLGHRFHHPGPITLGGAHDYAEKLRACHVIVDQEERERIIRDGTAMVASGAGLALVEDEGLVVENAGLTEWPVPLLGRFDTDFLDVPREVIVLTMRTNQKYFACTGDDGALAPAFVCTANIDATDGGHSIVEGNRRVLAARLADARFFWEQDVKVPLEEQAKKLSAIVFHEKLGTVADKVERVARLARWLVEQQIVIPAKAGTQRKKEKLGSRVRGNDEDVAALADQAERAARLAKADLVTGMVGEFPELQGVIGGYLAEAQGEPKAITDAVRDHYKPAGQGDEVPTDKVTVAVNIADRLKVHLREKGARHDLIDAVFVLGGEDDLLRLLARVAALQEFVETSEGADLLAGYKRAANILKKEKWDLPRVMAGPGEQGIPQTGEEDPLALVEEPAIAEAVAEMVQGSALPADAPAEEVALVAAIDAAEPRATAAIEAEDFTAAMAALASLRAPIDAFFDKVTVNDPNSAKRASRLNLLTRFRDAVNRFADFSKIEG